jgi:Ni/Co efflux regulator RcnB
MVAACLAALAVPALAPTVALAQDSDGGRHRPRAMPERHDRIRAPDETPAPQRAPRAERPSRSERPRANQDRDRPNRPSRPDRPRGDGGHRPDRPQGGQRPDRPHQGGQQRPDRPRGDRDGSWSGQNRPGSDHRPGRDRNDRNDRNDHNGRRDHNGRDRGGWTRGDRNDHGGRRDHERDRRDFRNRFNGDQWRRDWNRRHGNDWWRRDRRWNSWSGVRIGFYFSPGYGYYSVPRSYAGRRWYSGDYLPSIFWRYRLDDWRTFDLGVPPPGTQWVWVNNDLYLIDSIDGYILEAVYNVGAW